MDIGKVWSNKENNIPRILLLHAINDWQNKTLIWIPLLFLLMT